MPDTNEELENTEETTQIDPLDLSDEEFAKLDFNELLAEDGTINQTVEATEETEDDVVDDEEASSEEDHKEDEEKKETTTDESDSEEVEEEVDTEEDDKEETSETEEDDKTTVDKNENKEEETVDYEAQVKQLLSPFKANGKEIKVDNVDDAITLMQMGANYNKKMAGLKPNLKLLKMLENNNLLDESKINYLIDLDKKDPEAIKKLVKDSEIDPLDIDVNKENEYKPKSYTVDDNVVELDGILDDIRDTDSYATTVDIISNKWDDSSKKALIANPTIIRTINNHVASGVYQQINSVIESERMLGRLQSMTDIQAYQHVGKAIEANGGFTNKTTESNVASTDDKPAKKVDDPKLKKLKKATTSTKSTVSKKSNKEYNPLAMSDKEFEKQGNPNFM